MRRSTASSSRRRCSSAHDPGRKTPVVGEPVVVDDRADLRRPREQDASRPQDAMCVCERGPHVGALTFDDDLPHVEVVAPILRRANLPAAFFLCGASLDRPQPFWWHDLQVVVDQRGASPSRLRSLPELDLTPAIRRVPHAVHEIAEHIERMPPERRSAVAEELRSHAGKLRRALSARGSTGSPRLGSRSASTRAATTFFRRSTTTRSARR